MSTNPYYDDDDDFNDWLMQPRPLLPTYVPLHEMSEHPILRRALATGNEADAALEWPGLNSEQKRAIAEIRLIDHHDGVAVAIPPHFNLDVFISDANEEEAPPLFTGRSGDEQRYYTQATDTGFHTVGIFTAITMNDRRRYFQWIVDHWQEIGQSMFLYYRDDDDTHFCNVRESDIERVAPGATDIRPKREIQDVAVADTADDDAADADAAAADALDAASDSDDEPDTNDEEEDPMDEEDDMLMTEVDAMVQHGIAVGIASIAHRGQTDKLGYDYIDHPARVAESFHWLNQPVEHCAAWLHDVIEDTDITATDLLKAGMLPEIVEAVVLLTRREDVADADYYEGIRHHPIALAVKLADIDDNLAEWRFRKLDYDLQVRLSNKYFHARQLLQATPE
ncbi:hypothetical protein I6E74_00790 [Salinibacterium sp. SWN139]|uniref:hypothetical protein n=1 Tax=Salinibacterium sp. SWN139 TaxID=2792055 RepID=UPI0018CE9A83|nr:hypothetical protein [Salinibacterium sp. SWN139]MBH0052703.1 hypothetical protein [Salinibacterium sp. SWN139]